MALNPYDSCPCGSGKKFKWCCAPYFDQIELALTQQQENQHDASVRTMETLTRTHADKPQVWGYYAHILFAEGKVDEAESAIEKAFAIQSDFAMGHLLRGLFRQSEGEMIGALLLFRKAAETYHPDAHDQLAQVYEMIARNELMLNRPVACRAALEKTLHYQPADPDIRQQFDALFGEDSRLPISARKPYKFRTMTRQLPAAATNSQKLTAARDAFDAITKVAPEDPAAWFNLGLVRAWLGEQPSAVQALNRSVELEADDNRAEEAAALIEVLKCGQGMENDTDNIEHRVVMPIRDPQAMFGLLKAWDQEARLISVQADPQGLYFSALVVEELPSLLETGTKMATVMATLNIGNGLVRLSHPSQERVEKIAREIRDRLNLAVGEPSTGIGPIQFGDVGLEALAYPVRTQNLEEAEKKMLDFAENYFDNVWPNKPMQVFGGANLVDAVGSSLLRKRALGVIKFMEDCLSGAAPRKQVDGEAIPLNVYDFNRLRHKLGLDDRKTAPEPTPIAGPEPEPAPAPVAASAPASDPAPAAAPPAPAPAPKARDFSAMSAADLAGLPREELSCSEVEEAMKAAIRLDARELAVAFAKAGVSKPVDSNKPDRYPFYATLMTGAVSEGNLQAALEYADQGASYDAEHNDGKRGNDYGLRKALMLLKSGDVDRSAEAFDSLLERNPDDGNIYVKAAESMLGVKRGDKAIYFAEKGLARASSIGSRDLEGACRELLEAAKRYS